MRFVLVATLLTLVPTLVAAEPKNKGEWLYAAGKAAGEAGRYAEAIGDFSGALKLRPDALSYLGRGLAYERTGRYDLAIADLSRALALKPDAADAYESRAVAEDQKGLYDPAIADYSTALKLRPSAQTYFNRGAAFEHRRAYPQALADYRAALSLDPSLEPARAGVQRLVTHRRPSHRQNTNVISLRRRRPRFVSDLALHNLQAPEDRTAVFGLVPLLGAA